MVLTLYKRQNNQEISWTSHLFINLINEVSTELVSAVDKQYLNCFFIINQ